MTSRTPWGIARAQSAPTSIVREPSFGGKEAYDFAHEERIAFGLAVDGRDELGGRGHVGVQLDEARDIRGETRP